jgi:hypothetical protein
MPGILARRSLVFNVKPPVAASAGSSAIPRTALHCSHFGGGAAIDLSLHAPGACRRMSTRWGGADVAERLSRLRTEPVEVFMPIGVNARNRVPGEWEIGRGWESGVNLTPRQVHAAAQGVGPGTGYLRHRPRGTVRGRFGHPGGLFPAQRAYPGAAISDS